MRRSDRTSASRRRFLQAMGGIASVPLVGALSEAALGAGPFNDYRALVCVFFYGGNDAHNMVVPLDARYPVYAANRGPLALPLSALQATAISDAVQGPFALHPRMTRATALYGAGKLAVVSNVGVLLRPTTKTDYERNLNLPPQLFSHDDMQESWATCTPGSLTKEGWGGRFADLLQAATTGPMPIGVATGASGMFFKGFQTTAQEVAAYRSATVPIVQRIRAWRAGDPVAQTQTVYQSLLAAARTNLLQQQYGEMAARAVAANDFVLGALYNGPDSAGRYTERYPLGTAFPAGNPLAAQLRSVAMLIAARQALGVKRQIFFVFVGGSFDTHSDQFDATYSPVKPGPNDPTILFGTHADLLSQVDLAVQSFYDATVELGVANAVTTFTASDFGRTFTSNGKGSDHGWGSHHMVIGGAVKGGRLYGTFHNAQLGVANPVDAGQGRLIPDFGVEQYAATLAKWFGATGSDLGIVFPNLKNFGSADLGFMAA
ncbi:MAG: DUF1501 domain-containing protein [Betaproteobacteria bacterium]|nr:DUF1501 domain-containing protein [Betaproteobacteria bacterium]